MWWRWFVLLLTTTVIVKSDESAECLEHIQLYQDNLMNGKLWAVKMFDSATKLPDSILEGNVFILGNYDECLGVREPEGKFNGQYCRVKVENLTLPLFSEDVMYVLHQQMVKPAQLNPLSNVDPSFIPIEWTVCAPSTCGADGVASVASFNLNLILGNIVTVDPITKTESCYYEGNPDNGLDASGYAFIGVASAIGAAVIVATIYEALVIFKGMQKISIVVAFSLWTNVKDLIHMPRRAVPGTFPCLNGIRVLSMAWVVLGHRYQYATTVPTINAPTSFDVPRDWTTMPICNGFLAVDTFFLLSGLLISYSISREAKKGNKFTPRQLPRYYIYRYLRLTPPLAAMVMFLALLAEKLAHGPLWTYTITLQAQQCQKTWWTTLLYVNNYVDENSATPCVLQSWYLSVDMQLYWLAPLILIPLTYWPTLALLATAVLILASVGATFTVTYLNDLFWTLPMISVDGAANSTAYWDYVYINTPMRAVPYLFGIALGYVLGKKGTRPGAVFTKYSSLVFLGWVISTVSCLAVVYLLAIPYAEGYQYDPLPAAFYGSLHRLFWSIGLCWIIYACITGLGGPVNSILASRYWLPFSRLSYCMYLVQLVTMYMQEAVDRNPKYFSHFIAVHGYFGDLFLIVFLATIFYLFVEVPCLNLLRIAVKKNADNSTVIKTSKE